MYTYTCICMYVCLLLLTSSNACLHSCPFILEDINMVTKQSYLTESSWSYSVHETSHIYLLLCQSAHMAFIAASS